FSEKDIVKLERLGGRVLISLAAPYVSKEKRKRNEIQIGDDLIGKLRELRNTPDELEKQLDRLSVKQLRELGKFLDSPLRTKSPRQELISELVTHFHSEEVWKRISQIHPSEQP
ncbi:MAG: hypothetical protein WCB68_23495, partial [Pyrinomonadaceae bacterium]